MNIRKIQTIFFILLILTSALSVTIITKETNSKIQMNKSNAEKQADTDQYISSMYVLVNSTVYDPLEDELMMYKNDVENLKDLDVQIIENTYSSASRIRDLLKEGYNNDSLKGTFFVGNLPYAEYEISDDFEGYCRFPIDHYYTDLDGSWEDTDDNGILDRHNDGSGDLEPEIWFGRICMKTDWEEEIHLYKNYFRKIHRYRNGDLSLPHKGLLYVDDDWVDYTEDYQKGVEKLYPDTTVINDKETTNASDYSKRVKEGYEWIQIHCHANHSARRHAFKIDDGPKGSGGNFYSRDLYENGQKSLFANIFTCGSANYTVSNYLCGWYALTEDYGLANVGTTKPGSMLNFRDYYGPLSEGKSLGEAMKEWWINNAEMSRSWFYGMTTIGDPILSPTLKDDEDEHTYHYPIQINSDEKFEEQAQMEGWQGDGSQDDPYIIDGYEFSGRFINTCISISNTTVHFKISNNLISDAQQSGIYLRDVKNGTIADNKISNNSKGISLTDCSGDVISDNHFESNDRYNVWLSRSTNIVIKNNTMLNHGILINGDELEHWNTHTIDKNNTVNGKILYYLADEDDITVSDNAGQVILANCTGVIVKDLEMRDNTIGITISFSDDISVKNNIISENHDLGLLLFKSNNCNISNNSFNYMKETGIFLVSSNGNIIKDNYLFHNNMYGLSSFDSSGNILVNNNASLNHMGFNLRSKCNNNTLIGNTLSRNDVCGIKIMDRSNYNIIENNKISKNEQWGLFIYNSEENQIYHNNIYENTDQAYEYGGNNTWYNSTLNEGNYWGDYNGTDPDDDGIGDRPYQNISENNQDRYPLMDLWGVNEPPESPTLLQPENDTLDIDLNPVLAITVSDPDDDSMNVSFYDTSDDELIKKITDVKDDDRAEINWSGLTGETTYEWYVIVDDGEFAVKSDVWSFTTGKPKDRTSPTAEAGKDMIVQIGEDLTLDASNSYDNVGIVSYVWKLDDGRTLTGKQISLEYQKTGTHTVELTVTDEAGNTDSDTVEIKVERTRGDTWSLLISSLLFSMSVIIVYGYKKK